MNYYISNNFYKLKQSIYVQIPFLTPANKFNICQTDSDSIESRCKNINIFAFVTTIVGTFFFTKGLIDCCDYIGRIRRFSRIKTDLYKLAMVETVALTSIRYLGEMYEQLWFNLCSYDQNLTVKAIDQLAVKKIIEGKSENDANQWLENHPSAIKELGKKVHSLCIQMYFFLNSLKEPLPADCNKIIIANYLEILKSNVKITEEKIAEIFDTKL